MNKRYKDNDQLLKSPINYWLDLIQAEFKPFSDVERVRTMVHGLQEQDLLRYFSLENTGVFAYIITDDFLGGKCLAELMFYIRPENRGNMKLVLKYLKNAESIALDKKCSCVKIGSNVGYKDSAFIELLKRLGYIDDTVAKYI